MEFIPGGLRALTIDERLRALEELPELGAAMVACRQTRKLWAQKIDEDERLNAEG